MQYTVNDIVKLTGITARTVRYYDQINLLKPDHLDSNGYRYYQQAELDRLQQILFFRKYGLSLKEIQLVLSKPNYDIVSVLEKQGDKIQDYIRKQELLLSDLRDSIQYYQGKSEDKSMEQFVKLKAELIADNEEKYAAQAVEEYGQEAYSQTKANLESMTEKEFEKSLSTEGQLIENLIRIRRKGLSLDSIEAKHAFELHAAWLKNIYPNYTKDYHKNLADLYQSTQSFQDYYNGKAGLDVAPLLIEIIKKYV
ncbi:MerR family transcriptional regulator [Eupransor demetentiae]|uniref:MerR family (SoxR) n=1 Tax=Eupransor demetentiae TaxID=3109584 RepID=A0ABM9N568_9LACO|nr:DNA-binding transcriptional regulator [Lactobacillaceae bacterium LMG 33000]